ncbi:hypothetical protein [Paraclostridium sordellii]|uniref:hypothetical protein n=1 Tax=Paraclostridium sordellii TaxID=1505 RepID=UPI0005E70664|nr:hypothetical protein [Paeniclostridium sordellii]MBX9179772.1 hypothetical protein [Paeniclostridium sordellii]CEO11873.1 Uncharacterised protein [[Clostridium] sordellii] [Paeniclostridium sordellii]CEQ17437.1 Uncharacterised protein [[Clostridium] sordellii] [Paeniclostridium sordellii]CEQ26040.1 Uncharacterised protein [[Clostridium] sordellii] [Paeniclostridium sordellii]
MFKHKSIIVYLWYHFTYKEYIGYFRIEIMLNDSKVKYSKIESRDRQTIIDKFFSNRSK